MKLFRSVLVLLVFLSIFMVQNVQAETLSGRYKLNANGFTGYFDFQLTGEKLTGSLTFTKSSLGAAINQVTEITGCKVKLGKYGEITTIAITFKRSTNQVYYGWFSTDRKLIAGYFTHSAPGEKEHDHAPWYASKVE